MSKEQTRDHCSLEKRPKLQTAQQVCLFPEIRAVCMSRAPGSAFFRHRDPSNSSLEDVPLF